MTKHRDRESRADELTRRVAELKRSTEDEPLAPALETLWAEIEGCFDELRKVSTALVTAEAADQPPLLAQWNSQYFLLDSAFCMVEEKLIGQSGYPSSRIASRMASISTSLRAATALVRDEELRTIEDPELRRLHTVLAERLHGTRLAFSQLERYLRRVYGEGQ